MSDWRLDTSPHVKRELGGRDEGLEGGKVLAASFLHSRLVNPNERSAAVTDAEEMQADSGGGGS